MNRQLSYDEAETAIRSGKTPLPNGGLSCTHISIMKTGSASINLID